MRIRPESPLPAHYARWQEELAAAFFEGVVDTPVIFFIDDDELHRLAPTVDDPARSLAMAVREVVALTPVHHMFDRAREIASRWARGPRDSPPPVLPILALSSLAAARMHSDALVRRHNYYFRFAQVLLPEDDGTAVERAQLALRTDAFIPVMEMWQMLDRWLAEQHGAAGISTIRDHPTLTRIGYPLSQAMIRRSDRAVLSRFFAALHLTDLGSPGSEALIEYLRLWAARPRGFSSSFLRVLEDADLRPLLQAVVSGLASSWDGRVITSEGLAHCEAAVLLDLEEWATAWVIKAGSTKEPDVVRGRIGETVAEISIHPDTYSAFARITGAPNVDPRAIHEGFRLRGARCMVEFPATRLLVFREHPDVTGWVSGGPVEPFTEHIIAVSGELAHEVRQVLNAAADDGWRQVQQPADRPLLPGFTIFHAISFSDPTRVDRALAAAVPVLRLSIRPEITTRARLVNGLPVASRIGRNHYLAGGEPDLLLPIGDETRTVPAALDGTAQQPPFTATGLPIELRRIGPLPEGPHTIETDLDVLHFVLLERDPAIGLVPGTGRIGWDETGRLQTSTDSSVCGAVSPRAETAEPVLVHRGADRAWAISRTGICASLGDPPAVTGPLSEIDGIGGYHYEVFPGPDDAWLAEERRGHTSVRLLRRLGPDFGPLDEASVQAWSIIAPHGPHNDPLWQLYVQAWEHRLGH